MPQNLREIVSILVVKITWNIQFESRFGKLAERNAVDEGKFGHVFNFLPSLSKNPVQSKFRKKNRKI